MDLIVWKDGVAWKASFGAYTWPCAVGPTGARRVKREGDGVTPVGFWPMKRVMYRNDRLAAPRIILPVSPIEPSDGWCTDPTNPMYNRPVILPYKARHERLWREDEIYDVVVVLGFNDDPPVSGRGSAIFLHIARPNYSPTQGCVALAREHLLAMLRRAEPGAGVCIRDEEAPNR